LPECLSRAHCGPLYIESSPFIDAPSSGPLP
jgi:hypothetical protein